MPAYLQPAALDSSLYSVARSPEIGLDSADVYFSREETGVVGTFKKLTVGETSGDYVWTPNTAFALPVTGRALSCVAKTPISVSTGETFTLTITVTHVDDTSGTWIATFASPAWSSDQSDNMGQFSAVDFQAVSGGDTGKLIKAVTGISAVNDGLAGVTVQVLAVPTSASWQAVGCTREKGGDFPFASTVYIACGIDPQRFALQGRPDSKTLKIAYNHVAHPEGLTRIAGIPNASLRIDVLKAQTVLVSRILYAGYQASPSVSRGDGNDEVQAVSEGGYTIPVAFTAG